jgi:hypothetical protein
MELTGKCKEEFEKWYLGKFIYLKHNIGKNLPSPNRFYRTVESMQYGVYVDFFDSVFIYIHIDIKEYGFDIDEVIHECEVFLNSNKVAENLTRPEARTAAIEKANEIYNLNQ